MPEPLSLLDISRREFLTGVLIKWSKKIEDSKYDTGGTCYNQRRSRNNGVAGIKTLRHCMRNNNSY